MPQVSRAADQMYLEPMQVDLVSESQANVDSDFIVENTTLEIDYFSLNYVGLSKLRRLLFVAKHCPSLELDALKLAHDMVKQTYNTKLYEQIVTRLIEASSRAAETDTIQMDMNWIEATNKKAAVKLEQLDSDLKNHKTNSIKESTRRGHDDLGDHYLDCGDLKKFKRLALRENPLYNLCVDFGEDGKPKYVPGEKPSEPREILPKYVKLCSASGKTD